MESVQTIESALTWRNEYGRSVIPIRMMGKVPLVKWTPWVDKLQPEQLVKFWFKRNFPCNVAVILGDGLSVIDFDTPIAYANWRIEMPYLAKSLTVKTGRGWHVYLWMSVQESHTFQFDGGEIKCNGIVIAPPSMHKNGRFYHFVNRDARILGAAGIEDLGVRILEVEHYRSNGNSGSNTDSGTTVQRIKRNINIALWLDRYTTLKEIGDGSLMGICPFHNDKIPSLQVFPDEGRCYCHSPHCKAHRRMDVINVAEYLYDLTPREAVGLLAAEL